MRILGWATYISVLAFIALLYNKPNSLLHPEYHAQIEEASNLPKGKKIELSPNLKKGKLLFRNYCASCHNKNMMDDLVGPALKNVDQRWAAYPREDLYQWIRNAPSMEAGGHPKAIEVAKYSQTDMAIFPNLKDDEIADILKWIGYKSAL